MTTLLIIEEYGCMCYIAKTKLSKKEIHDWWLRWECKDEDNNSIAERIFGDILSNIWMANLTEGLWKRKLSEYDNGSDNVVLALVDDNTSLDGIPIPDDESCYYYN